MEVGEGHGGRKKRPWQHGDLGGRERKAWRHKKERMEVGKGDNGGVKRRSWS